MMEHSKSIKLEAYKKACELYPDSEDPLMQEYIHALRMGVQVGWIKCKEDTTNKAWEFIRDNLLEYTGLDSYEVEEAYKQLMEE